MRSFLEDLLCILTVYTTLVKCSSEILSRSAASGVASEPETFKGYTLLTTTTATAVTDGYERYLWSAHHHGHEVVNLASLWPDSKDYQWGDKIPLAKVFLEQLKNRSTYVVLLTDSYDLVITAPPKEILQRFLTMDDTKILFGAEVKLWPNRKLFNLYPKAAGPFKYLNAGMIIGYADELYWMLSNTTSDKNDQVSFSMAFVNSTLRNHLQIKLDTECRLFMNLHFAEEHVTIQYNENKPYLLNKYFNTTPLLIHGSGESKDALSTIANYVVDDVVPEHKLQMQLELENYPIIIVGLFLSETETPSKHAHQLNALQYPKNRIHLRVFTPLLRHDSTFKSDFSDYKSFILYPSSSNNQRTRQIFKITKQCQRVACNFLFYLESSANLSADSLTNLVLYNRSMLSPLLRTYNFSNNNFVGYDGPINHEALDIAEGKILRIWNVRCISNALLVKADYMKLHNFPSALAWSRDGKNVVCHSKKSPYGDYLYLTNKEEYGYFA